MGGNVDPHGAVASCDEALAPEVGP